MRVRVRRFLDPGEFPLQRHLHGLVAGQIKSCDVLRAQKEHHRGGCRDLHGADRHRGARRVRGQGHVLGRARAAGLEQERKEAPEERWSH